jgi:hypothetical protein
MSAVLTSPADQFTLTQADMDTAALVLIVDHNGAYRWSATKTTEQVVAQMHRIAEAIQPAEVGEPCPVCEVEIDPDRSTS